MISNDVNYIRSACNIDNDIYYIVNNTSTIYRMSGDMKSSSVVAKLIEHDPEWTIQYKDGVLYCISLVSASIIAYNLESCQQSVIGSVRNKTPYMDARIVGDYVVFVPWTLDNAFVYMSLIDGSLDFVEVNSKKIIGDLSSPIYRWNYYDSGVILLYKNMTYCYKYDFVERRIEKIVLTRGNISDVCQLNDNLYVVYDTNCVEIIGCKSERNRFLYGMKDRKYRKLLCDGYNIFIDANTVMDVIKDDTIMVLPFSCVHKDKGSNFYCVVKYENGWVFTPWCLNKVGLLSKDMTNGDIYDLKLSFDDIIKTRDFAYEEDSSLKSFLNYILEKK